jgi:hypothetical protein
MSLSPRVFRLTNFLSPSEAALLLDDAGRLSSLRESVTAIALKRRAFDFLGMYPADDQLVEDIEVWHQTLSLSLSHTHTHTTQHTQIL